MCRPLSYISSSAGPAAEYHQGQHLEDGPYRRPRGIWFFADMDHSMAGHRVGFLSHCQFLPSLESVPVDGERCAGKLMREVVR